MVKQEKPIQIKKVVGLVTGKPQKDGRYALALECGHVLIAFKDAAVAYCQKCDSKSIR